MQVPDAAPVCIRALPRGSTPTGDIDINLVLTRFAGRGLDSAQRGQICNTCDMQQPPDDDALVRALQVMTRDLVAVALASVDAVHGLGLLHTRVLFAIENQENVSGVELAGQLGISPSTVTRHIDRLVRSGHVLREQNPANRSMVMLRLTQRGRETVAEVLAWRARVFERISCDMTPAARAEVATALDAVHAALLDLEGAQGDAGDRVSIPAH